jgi:hypothetical protein
LAQQPQRRPQVQQAQDPQPQRKHESGEARHNR